MSCCFPFVEVILNRTKRGEQLFCKRKSSVAQIKPTRWHGEVIATSIHPELAIGYRAFPP
jgi:hypothetical protein